MIFPYNRVVEAFAGNVGITIVPEMSAGCITRVAADTRPDFTVRECPTVLSPLCCGVFAFTENTKHGPDFFWLKQTNPFEWKPQFFPSQYYTKPGIVGNKRRVVFECSLHYSTYLNKRLIRARTSNDGKHLHWCQIHIKLCIRNKIERDSNLSLDCKFEAIILLMKKKQRIKFVQFYRIETIIFCNRVMRVAY